MNFFLRYIIKLYSNFTFHIFLRSQITTLENWLHA